MELVKIRYTGPQTEGLWLADTPAHAAADFEHHEHPDVEHDGFVEVTVELARELLEQQEPIPPGEPVVVGHDEGTGDPILRVEMRPVWELAPDVTLPDLPAAKADADGATAKPKPAARRGGRPAAK